MKIIHKLNNYRLFTVVSYYTLDTIYEDEISRLIASLEEFKLSYYIEGIPLLGDWKQCTDYKATFIKRAMTRVCTNVVFIDADGEVVKHPTLFQIMNYDVAAFVNHIHNLLSGTLYLANNERVKTLLDLWIQANDANKSMLFEQKVLQNLLFRLPYIKFGNLPIGYCQIHNYKFQDENGPTILHWQASRRSKKMYAKLSDEKLQNLKNSIELESSQLWQKEVL